MSWICTFIILRLLIIGNIENLIKKWYFSWEEEKRDLNQKDLETV